MGESRDADTVAANCVDQESDPKCRQKVQGNAHIP
jgi:hypothetical protein